MAAAFACGPKEPSYSNINLNKNSQEGRAPAPDASATPEAAPEAQAEATPSPDAPAPAAGASPPPAAAQTGRVKMPSFFDPQAGAIKDLPSYPGSRPVNVQYGPLSGADMAMIVSETTVPMEKITQFYDRAVKSNGWTVASEMREPEKYRLDLKKGNKDAGTVQVTKAQGAGLVTIAISRTQAP